MAAKHCAQNIPRFKIMKTLLLYQVFEQRLETMLQLKMLNVCFGLMVLMFILSWPPKKTEAKLIMHV